MLCVHVHVERALFVLSSHLFLYVCLRPEMPERSSGIAAFPESVSCHTI